MSAFSKRRKILRRLQEVLQNCLRAGDLVFRNVILYNFINFDRLQRAGLPAIFISANDTYELETNKRYAAISDIDLIIRYSPENNDEGVETEMSQLEETIKEQINDNFTVGLSFVDLTKFVSLEEPIYIDQSRYEFAMKLEIQYSYFADKP
jgi:hypothetical protein